MKKQLIVTMLLALTLLVSCVQTTTSKTSTISTDSTELVTDSIADSIQVGLDSIETETVDSVY